MGHMSTIYLHCHDAAHFQQIESNFLTSSFRDAPSAYIGIPQDEGTPLDTHRVKELSARYATEAIGLRYADSVFEYLLYREGKLIRHLRYINANSPCWDVAEGDAQPWESTLFESPVTGIEPNTTQLTIQADERTPEINPKAAAHTVAVYYRLSGWLDAWEATDGQQPWWKIW